MTQKALEELLHRQIPLSKFMQVEVTMTETQVELQSELTPNHNHLGTAFGGSLSCLMILAGYCQIFRLLNESGHVVVKSTTMNFNHPVEEKLKAVCSGPSPEEATEFLKMYNKKGKARLQLNSQIILSDGRVACTMTGEFVGIQ
ncbi:MAG: YiiD C-terminal domain-containing protein [Bdellovibrio sp.]